MERSKSLPTLSIVSPSFNQGRYIEQAITSVRDQDYPYIEHIIVDGGSTDGTLGILKKYPHLVWISEPDRGQSDALNKGFRMATGDIIGWLNTDDYYLPGAFQQVAEAFAQHPEADLIYGNWYFVDDGGNIIKKSQVFPFNYRQLIYYGPYIGTTALFFRRSIIDEGHFIDIRFRYVMDWEWYARLAKAGKKFVFVNHTFACFRLHGDNQSMKFKQMGSIDRFFVRAQQLAEGYSIRRYYGHHWGKDDLGGNLLEEVSFRVLWWYFYILTAFKRGWWMMKSDRKELRKRLFKANKRSCIDMSMLRSET